MLNKGGVLFLLFCLPVVAQAQSVQPYIDKIKADLDKEAAEEGPSNKTESFIEKTKKEMQARDEDEKPRQYPYDINGSYIEHLKKQNPERFAEEKGSESYTEKVKEQMEPSQEKSAIQAVKDGTSQLEFKRPGKVRGAFGLILPATFSSNRSYSAGSIQANAFEDVYGNGSRINWHPDLTLFYEWKPFGSSKLASVGLVGMFGFSIHSGKGIFDSGVTLVNPFTGVNFGGSSDTSFTFISLPVTVGANLRFNLLHLVRPFVFAGPTATPYFETRTDGLGTKKGKSFGLQLTGGIAIPLDFLSKNSAWMSYEDSGIKTTYLTIEYQRLTHLSGAVELSSSGIYSGFTFDI